MTLFLYHCFSTVIFQLLSYNDPEDKADLTRASNVTSYYFKSAKWDKLANGTDHIKLKTNDSQLLHFLENGMLQLDVSFLLTNNFSQIIPKDSLVDLHPHLEKKLHYHGVS